MPEISSPRSLLSSALLRCFSLWSFGSESRFVFTARNPPSSSVAEPRGERSPRALRKDGGWRQEPAGRPPGLARLPACGQRPPGRASRELPAAGHAQGDARPEPTGKPRGPRLGPGRRAPHAPARDSRSASLQRPASRGRSAARGPHARRAASAGFRGAHALAEFPWGHADFWKLCKLWTVETSVC